MTMICNFPISRSKRCKQPMADNKPNCGRHKTGLSAEQLGQNPTVHRKNGELHVWAGEPDGAYCLIHGDPAYQALCQLAGETLLCCLKKKIVWRDANGDIHREDGPALIRADGTQERWQHGYRHRDDGPAVINAEGTQFWFQRGELHRDGGPAVVWSDGTQKWYRHDKLHRDDGPAWIEEGGTQTWWQNGELHRDDGPALIEADGTQEWYWHDEEVTEEEHAKLLAEERAADREHQ